MGKEMVKAARRSGKSAAAIALIFLVAALIGISISGLRTKDAFARSSFLNDVIAQYPNTPNTCGNCHSDWAGSDTRNNFGAMRFIETSGSGSLTVSEQGWDADFDGATANTELTGSKFPGRPDRDGDGYISIYDRAEESGLVMQNMGMVANYTPDGTIVKGWDLDDNNATAGNCTWGTNPGGGCAVSDTTLPAKITDLRVNTNAAGQLNVQWTSPGDDGATGTAHSYDIRYTTQAFASGKGYDVRNPSAWNTMWNVADCDVDGSASALNGITSAGTVGITACASCGGGCMAWNSTNGNAPLMRALLEPVPQAAGTTQSKSITSVGASTARNVITDGTLYWVGMRSWDGVTVPNLFDTPTSVTQENISPVSNIVAITTGASGVGIQTYSPTSGNNSAGTSFSLTGLGLGNTTVNAMQLRNGSTTIACSITGQTATTLSSTCSTTGASGGDYDIDLCWGACSTDANVRAVWVDAYQLTATIAADVSFVGTGTTFLNTGNGTNIDVAVPAGAAVNDILVAHLVWASNTTVTAPAGWTLIRSTVNGTTLTESTYYRVANGTEGATQSWTLAASAKARMGVMTAYRNADSISGSPIDGNSGLANGWSTTVSTTAITTTVAKDMILTFYAATGVNTTTTPAAGMTEAYDANSGGGCSGGCVMLTMSGDYVIQASAGSTGTKNGTLATGGANIGQIVAIKPYPQVITVGDGTAPANSFAKGSATNKTVSTFTLSTSFGTSTASQLQVTHTGTDADISAVRLWKDNDSNGTYSVGDTQVGTDQTFTGGVATFGSLTESVTSLGTNYLITFNTAAAPTNGNTHQARISAITVSAGLTQNNDTVDATLTIDTGAPTVSASASGGYTFGAWTGTSPITVTITPSDAASGVASTSYCIDTTNTCTPTTGYLAPVDMVCTVGSICNNYIRYSATDNAGNVSSVGSSNVKQDVQSPTDGSLTAAPGSGNIQLDWTAASDGSGVGLAGANTYKLVRVTGGTPPADCTAAATYQGTLLTHLDNSVVNGTTYSYRVCAYDAVGNASTGATATATAGLKLYTDVNSATVNSASQITGSASYTADANGNSTTKFEYNTALTWPGTTACAAVTGASPRTCAITGLTGNTNYYIRITHTDADGITGTNPADIGPYLTMPGAPAMAAFSGTTPTATNVNWTAPAGGAASYKVERAPDLAGSPGTWAEIATGVAATTYANSGLTCEQTYWYRVRASNASGDGAYSGNSSVTTSTCPDTTAPSIGTVTPSSAATATHVDGTFDLSANVTEANTVSSCQYTIDGSTWLAATVGGSAPNWTCTKTGIASTDGTVLTLNIRATDNSTNTGTGTSTSRTVDTVVPSTTDNSSGTWSATNITVTLTPTDARSGVTAATGVYGCFGTACTPAVLGGATMTTGCTAGSVCNQSVRYYSVDNVGNTETTKTAASNTRVDMQNPTDGATFTATVGNTQCPLSWSAASDGTGSGISATDAYKVVFLTGATSPNANCTNGTDLTAVTTATSYTHTGLTNGTQYSYRVCGIDSVGNLSTGLTATCTPAAGPTVPTLSSPTATSVAATTATLGATVTADGGATLTARGTCWATTASPTTNCVAEGGTTVAAYTHGRTGLTSGSLLYYRGYAVNSQGTGYSSDGSFYTEPSAQATGVNFTSVTATGMTVNWTRGTGGDGVIVLMKAGSAVDSNPVDGTYTGYTASTAFASGTQLGTGNYVIFKGVGTSVAVTGLTSGTTYHVAVYEYKGAVDTSGVNLGTNYLLTPATGNQITVVAPTVTTPTATSVAATTATLGATVTNNGGQTLTARGTCWATTASPTTNCVAEGGTTVAAFTHGRTGLTSGSLLYYRGYATNSAGTGYSSDGSFYTEPSAQATGVNFTSVTATSMTVNWTRGTGGDGVIVLMKSGSAVNSDPVDGTYTGYTASTTFASGTQLGTGNYVIFKGVGTSVAVTGLTGSTTYHVAVYEYAGAVDTSGVNLGTNYLLTPATGSQATSAPPDGTPPTFSGLGYVGDPGSGGTVTLCFNDATDTSTPITYKIYYNTASPATGGSSVSIADPATAGDSASCGGTAYANKYNFTINATNPSYEDGVKRYFTVHAVDNASNETTGADNLIAIPYNRTLSTGFNMVGVPGELGAGVASSTAISDDVTTYTIYGWHSDAQRYVPGDGNSYEGTGYLINNGDGSAKVVDYPNCTNTTCSYAEYTGAGAQQGGTVLVPINKVSASVNYNLVANPCLTPITASTDATIGVGGTVSVIKSDAVTEISYATAVTNGYIKNVTPRWNAASSSYQTAWNETITSGSNPNKWRPWGAYWVFVNDTTNARYLKFYCDAQ